MRHQQVLRAVKNSFGFLFDIDGVITRGRNVLPAAKRAFKLLSDGNGKFRVPVVFVTNAGNSFRSQKAKQLTEWLGVQVREDQVVMSHSPMKMFKQFHSRHVLISGQGPVVDIAKNTGFTKVVTIDTVRQTFPMLDMVDHKRRMVAPCAFEDFFPKIEAIVLFGEPVRWETNLQLIIDILLTNGQPNTVPDEIPYPHIPVLACNMDMVWMAEAKTPRFGHGTFLLCLEAVYKRLTGRELVYTAHIGKPSEITYQHAEQVLGEVAGRIGWDPTVQHIYCVGDNPETDICGANLYNRYLERKRQRIQSGRVTGRDVELDSLSVAGAAASRRRHPVPGTATSPLAGGAAGQRQEEEESETFPQSCESILVQTGVFSDSNAACVDLYNHAHRDFNVDTRAKKPTYMVRNVHDAVELVFDQEGFS